MKRILFALLTLSSCGGNSSDRSDPLLPDFPGDDAYAANYFIQDPECQTGTGIETVSRASYFEYNGSESVARQEELLGVKSVSALSNAVISSTMYGLHQRSQCEYNGATIQCGDSATLLRAATFLKVCRAEAVFDRNSVEGVSLSAMSNLGRAYNFYQGLSHHNASLMRTSLLVFPKVERAIAIKKEGADGGTTVINKVTTDNLAYTPEFVGEPAFVIYPKGKSVVEEGLWTNLNLWEVPFALAHEFGHHVMRTHSGVINGLGKATDGSGLALHSSVASGAIVPDYWRKHSSNSSDSSVSVNAVSDARKTVSRAAAVAGQGAQLQRSVTPNDLWGAVNEGFADLFGYYATGAQAGSLSRVNCFRMTREVDSPAFANGTSKVVSAEVLRSFLSDSVESAPDDCGIPYFQSIHTLGAMIAHGVDRLIIASGVQDSNQRAEILLLWGTHLRSLVGKEKAAAIGFADLVGTLLPVLALDAVQRPAGPQGKVLPAAVCDAARKAFPVFSESWFAAGKFTCQ